MVNLKI